MNTVRMWEEMQANMMPSLDYMLYDGWLLRF